MPQDRDEVAPGGAPSELEAAELWAATLELEPSGLAVVSGDTLRIRVANPAFRAAVPTPDVEPVGRSVEEVWSGEVGHRMRAVAEEVLTTGRPALHERYAHVGGDGVRRVYAFHVTRLPLARGPALLFVVWDTSEVEQARRGAERARERAELLAALAGELSAGAALDQVFLTALGRAASLLGAADGELWMLEPDGTAMRGVLELRPLGRPGERISLAGHPHSLRAATGLGPVLFSRSEAEGDELESLFRADAGGLLIVPVVERGHATGLLRLVYREAGRWPRPADVDFAEAIAGQCSLAVARARVYESERQARARAEAAEAEARRVGAQQERLAAVVGHDLRTPLAVVRLSCDALARRRGLDPAAQRAVARISSSAERMEAIIGDLLDFARTRGAGGMPVTLAPVRLDEVARQAVQEQEAATGRRVRLEVRGDCALSGDASRLGQVVSNLVGNALDHGGELGEVSVEVRGEGEAVRIAVHNDGPEIPPELLPTLFEPFRREPRGPGEGPRSGHLGLGLFIVAEIARAHGGAVEVSSSAGHGTTMTVTLPRSPSRR